MKKIVLSTLLLSSIICGSNKSDELGQAIKDSNYNKTLGILLTRKLDKNELERMVDLSQQIVSQRNKALISPSWAKIIVLSNFAVNMTKKKEVEALEESAKRAGFYQIQLLFGPLKLEESFLHTCFKNIFSLILFGLTITQAVKGVKALDNAYNSRKIRNRLLQISNENQETAS